MPVITPEIIVTRNQKLKDAEWQYRDDPEAFAWDILGVRGLFPKALEYIWAVAKNKKVAHRGAYGTAKTFWTAVLVIWFLYTRYMSRVVTTAPRERQVRDILWAEINWLYHNAVFALGGICYADRLEVTKKWDAIGITGNQQNEATMTGIHGRNVLFVGDESSLLKPTIYEVADRLCVGNDDKQVWIGNAIDPTSMFAGIFKDRTFIKIVTTAFDTPNVQAKKVLIPGMVTWEWVEDKRTKWGTNSQLYKSKVLGEFPSSADNAVIPLAWIEGAMQRWEELIEEVRKDNRDLSIEQAAEIIVEGIEGEKYLGCDVAGQGEDETIFARRREWFHLPLTAHQGNTQEVAALLQMEHNRGYGISVDALGIGAGVADAADAFGFPVIKVLGSESSDKKDSTGTFGFTNKRSELYWEMRERLNSLNPKPHALPRDEMLLEELALLTYKPVSGGKIQIEPKEKVKECLRRSPDRADATVYSLAGEYGTPAFYVLPDDRKEIQQKRQIQKRRW